MTLYLSGFSPPLRELIRMLPKRDTHAGRARDGLAIPTPYRRFFFYPLGVDMKFVINLTHNETGKTKVAKISAASFEDAKTKAAEKYSKYNIGRISSDTEDGVFYSQMRRMRIDL